MFPNICLKQTPYFHLVSQSRQGHIHTVAPTQLDMNPVLPGAIQKHAFSWAAAP